MSAITIIPANLLLIATYKIVPISLDGIYSIPFSSINFPFPTKTSLSSTFAKIPLPENSLISFTLSFSISFPKALFTDIAIGWFEKHSAYAVILNNSCLSISLFSIF